MGVVGICGGQNEWLRRIKPWMRGEIENREDRSNSSPVDEEAKHSQELVTDLCTQPASQTTVRSPPAASRSANGPIFNNPIGTWDRQMLLFRVDLTICWQATQTDDWLLVIRPAVAVSLFSWLRLDREEQIGG